MASLPVPSGGDQDRRGSLLAMIWIEASIAILIVSMRMYSRFKIKGVGTEYVFYNSISPFERTKIWSLETCLGNLYSQSMFQASTYPFSLKSLDTDCEIGDPVTG